jgi:hypothetical protein
LTQFHPRPQTYFRDSSLQNPASVRQSSDRPRDRGPVPSFAWRSFARPSSTRCGNAAFVPVAIFLCRAVDRPRIRPTRGASAISATISGGHGKASGRADVPRLHAGIISENLLLRTPLGEAGEQSHQAREQVPHQHTQWPRAGRRSQFFHQDGKTLGRVGGVGFHVC